MKDFDQHGPPDKIRSHHERNIKDEIVKREARMLTNRSHQTFQYNKKTGILSIAEIEEQVAVIRESPAEKGRIYIIPHVDHRPKIVKKIKSRENCLYFQKLNFKNAVLFLQKQGYKKIFIQKSSGGGD